jgi:outer membrane protein
MKTNCTLLFTLLLIGIFILLSSSPALSQIKAWTYNDCISYAFENNIGIKQKMLNNQVTDFNLEKAKANMLPTLNASASENLQFGRSLDPENNSYTTNNNASTQFGLSSHVNLFNGFQVKNTIKKYETDRKADEYDLEKMKNETRLNILNAYLQVLLAYEQLETAKNEIQSTEALVSRTEKLVNAGSKAMNELLQVKSQLATDRYNLSSRENTLTLSRVSLMQLMDLPVDTSFEIAAPTIDDLSLLSNTLKSSANIFDTALSVMPEIQTAQWNIKSAEYSYEIARGAALPQLNLSGNLSTMYSNARHLYDLNTSVVTREIGYLASNPSEKILADQTVIQTINKNYPFKNQLSDNFSQSVSLGLSIPIFNNKQVKTNKSIAYVNVLNEQLALQNTRNQLRKEIEQNQADLKASWNNYLASGDQVNAARESYKNAEAKFNLGMLNSTDLLVEKKNLSLAISNYLQAKYENLFQSKISDYFLGKQILF